MFEMPSPYSRPSRSNGCGWKPGTDRSHGSRPEYDVSMWPLNIRLFPPPAPARVASTFARPSSTCCHCTCRPIASSVCAISSAIACSSPVKLGVPIAVLAHSTSLSRSTFIRPAVPRPPTPRSRRRDRPRRRRAARARRRRGWTSSPAAHTSTSRRPASAGSCHSLVGSARHSSTDRGTCAAPGIVPARSRSSTERRSTRSTSASSASAGV